jgi:uncharacterized protein involved in exopolysaccharide biosynthesis
MAGTADIRPDQTATASELHSTQFGRRRSDMAWPYLRGGIISVISIWMFVASYLSFTPRTYTSRWTLNLPSAASSVSLSLESIGQSSSTPNSPFSSAALSPKVVYKEIAEGERVRVAAAKALNIEPARFGKPRVKLIDETALMLFEMTAPSPEEAKRRGEALMTAFNEELESLRNDELEKRAGAVRRNLSDYQHQVRAARDATVRAQVETGLVSTTQFSEMVTSLTTVRRRVADISAEADKLSEEQHKLAERLGVTPAAASLALKLASDTRLIKMLDELNEATTAFAIDSERFGSRHPQLMMKSDRLDAARQRATRLIERISAGNTTSINLETVTTIVTSSPRADLFLNLVRGDAALDGKRRELETAAIDKARLETDVNRLSGAAARLEDLKKDQLVADAVLSTAMARLDSSKSDIYGSYPIVQMVAPPDIADAAAQPRPLYAVLGGVSGTFFACLAWMLAWLQFSHRSTRRKNDSSSGPS